MKVVDQWTTVMGTQVFVTDANVRFIVNPSPCDAAGNRLPGVQSVEAYQSEPPRKLGQCLIPTGTAVEKWGQVLWGARVPRGVGR